MNKKIEKVKKETEPKRKIFLNVVKAFVVGGIICLLGELITEALIKYGHLEKDTAGIYSVIIMVFLGSVTTGLGLYDKIGQFGGCGTIVPITGFANSIVAPAMEYKLESKSEGVILGIINNMFKLAGSVIVVGVVSGVVIGLIRYLLGV